MFILHGLIRKVTNTIFTCILGYVLKTKHKRQEQQKKLQPPLTRGTSTISRIPLDLRHRFSPWTLPVHNTHITQVLVELWLKAIKGIARVYASEESKRLRTATWPGVSREHKGRRVKGPALERRARAQRTDWPATLLKFDSFLFYWNSSVLFFSAPSVCCRVRRVGGKGREVAIAI